ncbi:urea ABC transporter ATP-binding subunit UrtE [Cohaesibacter celericrescens]|uniref:Urea ABC transporter ATP-binding subunit UrtE n=1 Tax=Cohaesibacter celericrescens TaxID=2067669 RepID=A0A2N5XV41_9HYPH|nr:urea ABC transporter ATP-binding subunit UrtE [Cohaesibacter celericrescens]PLW78327.1 urea ABC transporter ATP-binding subunit UrtE [Cohaesibacter celericrescens]
MPETAALKVQSIDLHYGAAQALRNVSLVVEKAKITCVLGRNGVGKSSLLRAIVGQHPVSNGEILLGRDAITKAPSYTRAGKGIGYVPQGREIFAQLTVKENLETGYARLPRKQRFIEEEIFELFPILKDMLSRRGGDLSGGQQQQLAIGRALVTRPDILVLDEPTEGIQPSIIKDIGRAITYLRDEKGMAILLVEQYLDFCRELADVVHIMDRGEITHSGPAEDLDRDDVRSYLTV